MPQFTYVGDAPRLYPSLSLEVEPGQVVELDANPDLARFVPVDAPVDVPAPAEPAPEVTP